MTRIQIEEALNDLNTLVQQGKLMDAFEKYYHDDVVMQENNEPPTVSKEANRKRELQFLDDVTEFRKADVQGIGIGDHLSFALWQYDYTHKDWGVRNYKQVSVQKWKEGKIISEQFIY